MSCMGPCQLCRGRRLQLPRQRNKKGWTKTWELLITCWIYVESWTLSDPNSLNFGLHNGLTRSIFQLRFVVSSQRLLLATCSAVVKLAWSHSFRWGFGWWIEVWYEGMDGSLFSKFFDSQLHRCVDRINRCESSSSYRVDAEFWACTCLSCCMVS